MADLFNFKLPYGTCDTHHHIYNPRQFTAVPMPGFNWTPDKPEHTADEYKYLADKVGITHNIIIATSAYNRNPSSDLDALFKLGKDKTRAILYFKSDVTDNQIADWHEQGVRGTRIFTCYDNGIEDAKLLAPRFYEINWNLDFTFKNSEDFLSYKDEINKLRCRIVISHQAAISDVNDPALGELIKLLKKGNVWAKISGIYRNTDYPDFKNNVKISKTLVEEVPDRILWGTDWPHNWSDLSPVINENEKGLGHDTGTLLKLIPSQIENISLYKKILAENPAEVYGFSLSKNE